MGTFDSRNFNDQEEHYVKRLSDDAELLQETITEHLPSCRETSLALTKLEECVMWAKKAMMKNGIIQ